MNRDRKSWLADSFLFAIKLKLAGVENGKREEKEITGRV